MALKIASVYIPIIYNLKSFQTFAKSVFFVVVVGIINIQQTTTEFMQGLCQSSTHIVLLFHRDNFYNVYV